MIYDSIKTVHPMRVNGTTLSCDEFRDSIRIRLGLPLLGLNETCDGCNEQFSLTHAQKCPHGGLVSIRHDDMKKEFLFLCQQATARRNIRDEPPIYPGRGRTVETEHEVDETRGDISVYEFWTRRRLTMFDVSIVDTDADSYNLTDPKILLARRETAKKDKHGPSCLRQRVDFTPLVFSADGLTGKLANKAIKQLSGKLATKWNRQYSVVCGYVRSRLSISLVRSVSMLVRSPRHGLPYKNHPMWLDGAGLSIY